MPETIESIRSLRSIHGGFADEAVPEGDLRQILELSVRAANASNRQSYSIVVVRDTARMRSLLGYSSSVALFFLADLNRIVDLARHLGHEFEVRGLPMLLSSIVDASLAAQTAAIAAKALGIDSLFTNGVHRPPMTRLRELLSLPEKHCFPVVALLLGYPREEPRVKRGRLCGPGVVHFERYHSLTLEEADTIVEAHDDPAAGLDMKSPWKEQGFVHFLDWFYEVWSTRMPPEEGPSQVATWLQDAGFLD
jgi:nitroreductase